MTCSISNLLQGPFKVYGYECPSVLAGWIIIQAILLSRVKTISHFQAHIPQLLNYKIIFTLAVVWFFEG